jgi:hypothetical protein
MTKASRKNRMMKKALMALMIMSNLFLFSLNSSKGPTSRKTGKSS